MLSRFIFFFFIFCSLFQLSAQEVERIMFYNVENLFDTIDDSLKNDEEFMPDGVRYWNSKKLNAKLKRVYQVIVAASNKKPPVIIGMCEVENWNVLNQLLTQTPLSKMGYQFIHQESPDRRGIDVAFVYQADRFKPIHYQAIPVTKENDPGFKTRDILYVKGVLAGDTIGFFVNHWPSKYGGVLETVPLRRLAATTLMKSVDSIQMIHKNLPIIIMGDLNDSPFDESIQEGLKVVEYPNIEPTKHLLHPGIGYAKTGAGSNKYQGKWELIDQFIFNQQLTDNIGWQVNETSFSVFNVPFLLEKDESYLGEKPFRTYLGFKYHNGFSDHLPILLDLYHQ